MNKHAVTRRPFFWLPLNAAVLLVLFYVLLQAVPMLSVWITSDHSRPFNLLARLTRPRIGRVRVGLLGLGSVAYGLVRVARTHPSLRSKYSSWLKNSPWRPGLPLPLGPAELVWEEAIFALAVVLLTLMDMPIAMFRPIAAGLIPYAIGVIGSATSPGRSARLACYAIAIVYAALLPASFSPVLTGVLVVALIALLRVIVNETLMRLPWQTILQEQVNKLRAFKAADVWILAPRVMSEPIGRLDGWMGAVTISWVTFCFTYRDDYTKISDGWAATLLVGGTVALMRLLAYAINFAAPISTMGRITSGRFVISSYDKIWVIPIVGLAATAAAFAIAMQLSIGLPLATALAVGIAFAIAFNAGPTRRNWQLTGHHRIIFWPEQNQGRTNRRSS